MNELRSVTKLRVMARMTVMTSLGPLAGCYELQPAASTVPQPGEAIGLDINDAGRVALGGSMGPEIGQIEGRLVQRTPTEYVVAVTGVHMLRGGDQTWSGENVHVSTAYVTTVYERRLSKTKTVILAAVGAGAVAVLASRGLAGLGDAARPEPPSADTAHSVLRPSRP